MPQGGLGEGKESVNRLDTSRSEVVVDSSHENPRAWLSSGFRCHSASDDGIYHRAGACGR